MLKIMFVWVKFDASDLFLRWNETEHEYTALLTELLRFWIPALPIHFRVKQEIQVVWHELYFDFPFQIYNRGFFWGLATALSSAKTLSANSRMMFALYEIKLLISGSTAITSEQTRGKVSIHLPYSSSERYGGFGHNILKSSLLFS